jgi:hypothetical protein
MEKLIGKPVILRAPRAGVLFGTLESFQGGIIELTKC